MTCRCENGQTIIQPDLLEEESSGINTEKHNDSGQADHEYNAPNGRFVTTLGEVLQGDAVKQSARHVGSENIGRNRHSQRLDGVARSHSRGNDCGGHLLCWEEQNERS